MNEAMSRQYHPPHQWCADEPSDGVGEQLLLLVQGTVLILHFLDLRLQGRDFFVPLGQLRSILIEKQQTYLKHACC